MEQFSRSLFNAYLRNLHDLLIRRGWCLDDNEAPDEDGYPTSSLTGWSYPASYGAVHINDRDDAPEPLTAYFELDDFINMRPITLEIASAGNPNGCAEHSVRTHVLQLNFHNDAQGNRQLENILDGLEATARDTNVLDLIACRALHSCG